MNIRKFPLTYVQRKVQKILLSVGIMLSLLFGFPMVSMGEESENLWDTRNGEVVFLLDTSNSMNAQDKERLAIDAIRQEAYGLPSNYKVGLVAYNTDIQTVVLLDAGMDQMEAQLAAITYTGYTNAGEGLAQALGLFSTEEDTDRYIVMISDGEIVMKQNQQTESSRTLFAESAAAAKDRGVKIYITAIGNELTPQMHIFDAAEMTDGAIYWEGQAGSLSQIMERIAVDRFGIPRQSLGVTDAGGGSVRVEVPEGVSRMKIMLTSDNGMKEVMADYTADSGHTVTGRRFVTVDMGRPESGNAVVRFSTSDISAVQAYLLTEFTVKPKVSVSFRGEELSRTEEEVKKDVAPVYQHFADITIGMAGQDGEDLWQEAAYEGKEVTFLINGMAYTSVLQQGQLHATIPADDVERVEVSVDLSGFEGVYYVEQPVMADIIKVPDPVFEPKPDYRPLWVILGLAAASGVVLLVWIKGRATVIYVAQPPTSREPVKKMETKTCTYSGKFNMYVVRTENGRDIPPQTYRLFGRTGGRMTLDKILTSCGVKFGKIGADDVIFYPGPDHSVLVMDQSERCTVLRGTEILKKGMGYPVFYNEKVTITFEDEATEMEIHYKDLKPSERENI